MAERWWCTPCGALREYRNLGSVGKMCLTCGSGKVRPPLPGELPPRPATKPPPVSLDASE